MGWGKSYSRPKVFNCVKVDDLSLILFPSFGSVIFEEPQCPLILQGMFDHHVHI